MLDRLLKDKTKTKEFFNVINAEAYQNLLKTGLFNEGSIGLQEVCDSKIRLFRAVERTLNEKDKHMVKVLDYYENSILELGEDLYQITRLKYENIRDMSGLSEDNTKDNVGRFYEYSYQLKNLATLKEGNIKLSHQAIKYKERSSDVIKDIVLGIMATEAVK